MSVAEPAARWVHAGGLAHLLTGERPVLVAHCGHALSQGVQVGEDDPRFCPECVRVVLQWCATVPVIAEGPPRWAICPTDGTVHALVPVGDHLPGMLRTRCGCSLPVGVVAHRGPARVPTGAAGCHILGRPARLRPGPPRPAAGPRSRSPQCRFGTAHERGLSRPGAAEVNWCWPDPAARSLHCGDSGEVAHRHRTDARLAGSQGDAVGSAR